MRRALVVVPADLKAQANVRADEVQKAGGQPTFSVPLVNSAGTVVAYWCSWVVSQQRYDQLKAKFDNPGFARKDVRFFDGDLIDPDALLASLGLRRQQVDQ